MRGREKKKHILVINVKVWGISRSYRRECRKEGRDSGGCDKLSEPNDGREHISFGEGEEDKGGTKGNRGGGVGIM